MKTHELGLQPAYYNLIKIGEKIYEGRLNDEKRKLIETGDIIIIKKDPERVESFECLVLDKLFFNSFKDMIESLDEKDIGFKDKTKEQILNEYRKFYSEEKENKFGVVAIKLKVLQ